MVKFSKIKPELILRKEAEKLETNFADIFRGKQLLSDSYQTSEPQSLQSNVMKLPSKDFDQFKRTHMQTK